MWQKVSKDEHAHYKDICNEHKSRDRPELLYKRMKADGLLTPKPKSDLLSNTFREIGNKLFAEKKWSRAMIFYNRSLCWAETLPSERVSVAYANRSACFFEMKMYDKCLIDIELAKQANYPARLMFKIEKREADCLRLIEGGAQAEPFKPKLSFEPDERFPCLANVLEIKRNEKFGRLIESKCNIAVGQTVLVEEAYMTAHRHEKYNRCNGCMKKNVNLLPCENCTSAMFCIGCETNDFHQVECGMVTTVDDGCNDSQLHIVRSILQAMNIFSSIDELQTFVQNSLATDRLDIPASIVDEKTRYYAFLKSWYEANVFERDTFDIQVYFIYKTLLEHPIIGSKFNSGKKRRFLMHLIAQHLCIVNYAGSIRSDDKGKVGYDFNEFRSVVTLYVNHSCVPNVTLVSFDGYNVLVTIRPIKIGDQLFLSYFRNERINLSTTNRHRHLQDRFQFLCECQRCEGDSPSSPKRLAMTSDECYKYIQKNKQQVNYAVDDVMGTEMAKMLKEKCVEFLNKHGLNVWSEEVELVIDCYKRLLAATYNNAINF